ncbi:MAG: hypothetical protein R2682_15245 [Pyrinomonadaceae bacterium]
MSDTSKILRDLTRRVDDLHLRVESDRKAWVQHLDSLIETLQEGNTEIAIAWCKAARHLLLEQGPLI